MEVYYLHWWHWNSRKQKIISSQDNLLTGGFSANLAAVFASVEATASFCTPTRCSREPFTGLISTRAGNTN